MDHPIVNTQEESTAIAEVEPTAVTASGVTSSGVELELPQREVAYVIQGPVFGEFAVYKSANAWWMDRIKVEAVMLAYRAGATNEIACIQANISMIQLKYFFKLHPDFYTVRQACKDTHLASFLNTLNKEGVHDLTTVRWMLTKRHPDFGGKSEEDEESEALQPTAAPVINATGNVQINIDNGDIAAAIREMARVLAGDDPSAVEGISAEVMEGMAEEGPQ